MAKEFCFKIVIHMHAKGVHKAKQKFTQDA